MSKEPLSAGKLRSLQVLAADDGRFRMVAVDQRPPLFRALARHGDRRMDEVRHEEIVDVKRLLVSTLAPRTSAILVDPIWAHPYSLLDIPGSVGLMSTLEDYAYEVRDGERYSKPIEGWSVAKIKRSGAAGVKVLAHHRPDLSPAAAEHQDEFVGRTGEACREHDIPFILELLVYPKDGEEADSLDYAARKPDRVIASLRHFAHERFGVDLFKLEFPADLKRTAEFAAGAFDGEAREAAYSLREVEERLHELDEACPVPWVLLSAGVGPREFALNVELAARAGASGFLAGRAVWSRALRPYPDLDAVRDLLERESLPFLDSLGAIASLGPAWRDHRRFGGRPALEEGERDWYQRYAG